MKEVIGTVFVQTDIGKKTDVEELVKHVVDRFGRIDILCQNAVLFPYSMLPEAKS